MVEWNSLIEPLTDAFLTWKYGTLIVHGDSSHTDQSQDGSPIDTHSNPVPEIECTVAVYEIFSLDSSVTFTRPPTSTSIPVDLATHGYLAKTPLFPTVAVGFKTLEHFHRLRLRQPSLSIEAFTKVICDHYQVRVLSIVR